MYRLQQVILESINIVYYLWKQHIFFSYARLVFNVVLLKKTRTVLPNALSSLVTTNHMMPGVPQSVSANIIDIEHYYVNHTMAVKLAGVKHEISTKNLWNINYYDKEEFLALHRFGWMLVEVSDLKVDHRVAKFIILDWITNYCFDNKIGWDSYSISERISNWIIYLNKSQLLDDNAYKLVKYSIHLQLLHLLQHLELRGQATNNHLINNGRALYLGGMFLDNENFKNTGREILICCLNYMFSESGFLREGASHYQVLLARTYLEVFFYAQKKGDKAFEKQIIVQVRAIWKATCLFLEERQFPYFGDISPDFPPGFHIGVVTVGSALLKEPTDLLPSINQSGWHDFLIDSDRKNAGSVVLPKGAYYCKDAGYFRFRNESFSLYAFVNQEEYIAPWSHGHADSGHFVLYVKGVQLLASTGRVDYTNSELSLYGRSVKSHNAVQVDNREPCVVHGLNFFPELLPEGYASSIANFGVSNKQDNTCEITIKQYGYKRIDESIHIERNILINNDEVIVTDNIFGEGDHDLKTFFYFVPNTELEKCDKGIMITTSDISMVLSGDLVHSMSLNDGCISLSYGTTTITSKLLCDQQVSLPVKNRYSFKLITV